MTWRAIAKAASGVANAVPADCTCRSAANCHSTRQRQLEPSVGSALHVAVHRCVASGQADDFAGDGEHDRPIIGVAVAITSLGFNREGAVERELSNVRYPAPTGRSPIQVRWQDPTQTRPSSFSKAVAHDPATLVGT